MKLVDSLSPKIQPVINSIQELASYPADLNILNRVEVVYHEMPGWKQPTTNARTYSDLPKEAQDYVEVSVS